MKTILLGGLDPVLTEQIAEAFEPFKADYALQTVGSLGELLVLLETSQGDLLFLDLEAPDGVALEWLARLSEIKSSIPILGAGQASRPDITGYELRFPGHFFPFLTYLRKPLTPAQIVQAVQTELRHVARGVIEGLSLATLIQMLHLEGKTCTIRVTSGRRQGFFYMRAGQIINARYRRLEGRDAALALLASTAPKAEIDGQLHDSTQVIHARIEELMMEAMRIQDENTRDHILLPEEDDDDPADVPPSETGKWEIRPIAKTAAPSAAPPPPPPPAPRRKRTWLIAAAVILPFTAVPFLLPREARVAIQTTPPGAEVILDGEARGRTPLEVRLPKPVQGTLKVALAGYAPQTRRLGPEDEQVVLALQALPPAPAAEPEPLPLPEPTPMAASEPPPKAKKPASKPATAKPATQSKKGDVFDQVRQP